MNDRVGTYLTDDRDDPERHKLHISMGGNGDYYVGVVLEGQDWPTHAVRISTSGGASTQCPNLVKAVASAYRAMVGEDKDSRRLLVGMQMASLEERVSQLEAGGWAGEAVVVGQIDPETPGHVILNEQGRALPAGRLLYAAIARDRQLLQARVNALQLAVQHALQRGESSMAGLLRDQADELQAVLEAMEASS